MNAIFAEQTQRTIRVFVSSTFRDMQEERDELVKFIFPQLRKICEQRGVTWGQVDLRWGITEEQKAEGQVLPICLREIERCKPFFIGVLGERYGWIPEEFPSALLEKEPWLQMYSDHSVTELEILQGVLNNRDLTKMAYFYFRDPKYLDTIPSKNRIDFSEDVSEEDIKRLGKDDAQRLVEQRRIKLIDLKERIRKSGLPVRENYSTPKAFGEAVLKDLTAVINELYPEGSQPDSLDSEAVGHETFAKRHAAVYIERQEYLDRLNRHVRSESQPITVQGESGSGKSALLANWALQYGKDNPNDFMLTHFVGATTGSSDWAAMLRRILGEFKRNFHIEEDIPAESEELRTTFARWLDFVNAKGKVILIIDALSQLDDKGGALDLSGLPIQIPGNIRIILSTLPGRPLEQIIKRGWPILTIEPLQPEERRLLTKNYLTLSSRALDAATMNQIALADQCKSPLFLRVLLEELQLIGVHEKLATQIEHLLNARDIPELYAFILERCEQDYDRDRPGLTRETMSLLWAARRGLSEMEMLEILGKDGFPMPHAYWAPLYLAMEQSMIIRDGYISFSNMHFRLAVEKRFLSDESMREHVHLQIADYFEKQSSEILDLFKKTEDQVMDIVYQSLNPEIQLTNAQTKITSLKNMVQFYSRRADEVPWQYAQARAWDKLHNLLEDPDFLRIIWNYNSEETMIWWTALERHSSYRMLDTYRVVIENPDEFEYCIREISLALFESGYIKEATQLVTHSVEYYRRTKEIAKLRTSLSDLSVILRSSGDLDGAMDLAMELQHLSKEPGNESDLAIALDNQAAVLYSRGEMEQSWAKYLEAEAIYKNNKDRAGLSRTLGNKALILYIKKDYAGAMALHKEEEAIVRELNDNLGLASCLGNQALILKDTGYLDEAMTLHKEEEAICRELGDKDGLQHSLGNQAILLIKQGDITGATRSNEEQARICHETGNISVLEVAYRTQEQIRMELKKKDGLNRSQNGPILPLSNLCDDSIQQPTAANSNEASSKLNLLKEREATARNMNDLEELVAALTEQAELIDEVMQQPHKAFYLAKEALKIVDENNISNLKDKTYEVYNRVRRRL